LGDTISPGQELEIAFDGLRLSATVSAVAEAHIELTIPLKLPASSFIGVSASVPLGPDVTADFDLGTHATFTELRVAVPYRKPEVEVVPEATALPVTGAAQAVGGEDQANVGEALQGQAAAAEDVPNAGGDALQASVAAASPRPVSDEKRQYYRLMVKVGVEVYDDSLARKPSVVGQTVNLSGGGMLLALPKPLRPRVYHFRVNVPGDRLDLKGMVLLRSGQAPGFVAVNFVGITEGLRGRIIRFIFAKLRSLRDDPAEGDVSAKDARSRTGETKVSARERRSARLEGRLELSRFRRRR
jgi:hypothetical protein